MCYSAAEAPTVAQVLRGLISNPWRLVSGWNWKAGMLSALFRGAIFAAVASRHHWSGLAGVWLELGFRLIVGGFWGGVVQAFRLARPLWAAALVIGIGMPVAAHSLELALLIAGHATHIRTGMTISVAFSALSLLVNWSLMRRGFLLTGVPPAAPAAGKTKTLHITNWWAEESGGIATFYRQLLKQAEVEGREIRLVVPGPATRVERAGQHGVIYYVAAPRSRVNSAYRIIMPWQYLVPGSPLRRILAAERPHLVECSDKYTLNYFAGLLRRGWVLGPQYRPAVVGLSCERMDANMAHYLSRSPAAMAFCRWYMKWLHFPMFDHHIAVSEISAGELRDASHGHKVRRGVWVRPMGVDCELFRLERRTAVARKWVQNLTGAPDGARLVLYAGRLAPEKNLPLVLDCMSMLEQEAPGMFHLVIAGDGTMRDELEQACNRRLPGAACFLGHVAQRQTLADLLANCDVFVHPNPAEPFGLAPLEAMASGLALVAPNSGGVTTFANAGNAWLTSPTPQAFADAIQQAAEDNGERRRQARATAEQFEWKRIAAGYFELYTELSALVQEARAPKIEASFYSTTGNWVGREV